MSTRISSDTSIFVSNENAQIILTAQKTKDSQQEKSFKFIHFYYHTNLRGPPPMPRFPQEIAALIFWDYENPLVSLNFWPAIKLTEFSQGPRGLGLGQRVPLVVYISPLVDVVLIHKIWGFFFHFRIGEFLEDHPRMMGYVVNTHGDCFRPLRWGYGTPSKWPFMA